jgi:hypothetical protein
VFIIVQHNPWASMLLHTSCHDMRFKD